ncbi:aarF domain-containing protein kinase 1 isoform X2 [Tripterygium wilfordii]|uniref:aarF domain-containing protein kinase 1 isoform X2 n=1 Tax=Tripterygium wilfordii TaxID=458696 RepID=UPI0018F7EAE5|nr:aarF domain-containing protein kinase 1 isoform X2 [Tripterygium wilfordii]
MVVHRVLKFPVNAKTTTIYLLTAAGVTFQVASRPNLLQLSSSTDFFEKIRTGVEGVIRSSSAISTIAFSVVDYKYSLRGLSEDSNDYREKLSEVHLRSAHRILKMCEANKGFYVKAGQFVAAMRQVPMEYSTTLSSLQDQAVPCNFKDIKKVLSSNLGKDLSEIFLSFDEQPIAAASIAQAHYAILKDYQEVAVKVQYPGLERRMKIDTKTMSVLSKFVAWFFPDYRFHWLVSEFTEAISSELNFIQEAKNSERTAENFKKNNMVRVPRVYWELTTSHVLTMEFCRGQKVAKALVEIFAEMIFIHGFVHGDPHPGNILVSPEGPNGFTLVLLDHGIYRQLDEGFQQDYCKLWKALILLDSNEIRHLSERFGVGNYYRYFPLIFTGQPIDSKSALGRVVSTEEKNKIKQEFKSVKMEDISSFMESLPPDFLRILRTDGLLRSIMRKLGAPQQVRLLAYAKYAIYGLSLNLNQESEFVAKIAFSRLKANLSYLRLRLLLEILEFFSWMELVKRYVYTLCIKISQGMSMLVTPFG